MYYYNLALNIHADSRFVNFPDVFIFSCFFRDRLNVVDNELTLFRETQTNLSDSVREAQRRLYTNEGLVNSAARNALENEYVYTIFANMPSPRCFI